MLQFVRQLCFDYAYFYPVIVIDPILVMWYSQESTAPRSCKYMCTLIYWKILCLFRLTLWFHTHYFLHQQQLQSLSFCWYSARVQAVDGNRGCVNVTCFTICPIFSIYPNGWCFMDSRCFYVYSDILTSLFGMWSVCIGNDVFTLLFHTDCNPKISLSPYRISSYPL